MSWHYLQALVVDFSEPDFSAGDASAPWKSNRTAGKSSCGASGTVCLTCFRSGTTSEPSTADPGVASWISSLAASRASRSALQASDVAKMTNAICGPKPSESFAKWDRDSRCWRTYQGCLFTRTLEPYSETWPRAGIAFDGIVSLRQPLAPRTSGTVCSYSPDGAEVPPAPSSEVYWPTPDATGSNTLENRHCHDRIRPTLGKAARMWPTPRARDAGGALAGSKATINEVGRMVRPSGQDFSVPLCEAVKMWPTPTSGDGLATAVSRLLPTMTARDSRTIKGNVPPPNHQGGVSLTQTIASPQQSGGLNPPWVEWLMGFPIGWTDLRDLAMPRFQQWLEQFGN